MKKLFLLLSLIIISCDQDSITTLGTIDYTLIGKGQLNGKENIEESQRVIKDSISWNRLKSQMEIVNNLPGDFNSEVDFNTEVLIVIFDKVRPRTDFSFFIKNVVELSDKIVVYYDQNHSEGGYLVINQPFIVLKIPKTGKKITFETI